MQVLINSSKTMAVPVALPIAEQRQPHLIEQAHILSRHLQTLTPADLAKRMHLSPALAVRTHQLIAAWGTQAAPRGLAIDTFQGDIYKGLRAHSLEPAARAYADHSMLILSGLYGGLRPYDAIEPYRLEVGYAIRPEHYANLYAFWGSQVADILPREPVINLASEEYAKLVLPFIDTSRVISPLFLTVQKQAEPTFVAIHAKLARGACARWLMEHQLQDPRSLQAFTELGYTYDASRSSAAVPVFIRHGPLTLNMLH